MNKQEAQNRLTSIEQEVKELRKIINSKDYNWQDIKSFEDACRVLDINVDDFYETVEHDTKDEEAYKKLKIIIQAVNKDWTCDYSNKSQAKYYPFFTVLSSGSSFSLSYYNYRYDYEVTNVGTRLCLESEEKVKHMVKYFIQEYTDYLV